MAIEPVLAEIIQQLVPTLPNNRVLCLGYPDILHNGEPPNDEERKAIAKWHHWNGGVEDAGHFFGRQELDAEYWDVTQARGPEKIVNLNDAQRWHTAIDYEDVFGLVIDPGTLEHIANIGNCWDIICLVTSLNGLVIHSNPLTMANHGFYSLNPTAYADIYEANGFRIEMLLEISGPREKRQLRDAPKYARFMAHPDAMTVCVARKIQEVPFTWPIQTKYRQNPTLKAAQ